MNHLGALGDATRLRMVEQLAEGDRTAGELSAVVREEFGVSQPAASRHLRVLREAGLVQAEKRGTWVWYHAVDGSLEGLRAALS